MTPDRVNSGGYVMSLRNLAGGIRCNELPWTLRVGQPDISS